MKSSRKWLAFVAISIALLRFPRRGSHSGRIQPSVVRAPPHHIGRIDTQFAFSLRTRVIVCVACFFFFRSVSFRQELKKNALGKIALFRSSLPGIRQYFPRDSPPPLPSRFSLSSRILTPSVSLALFARSLAKSFKCVYYFYPRSVPSPLPPRAPRRLLRFFFSIVSGGSLPKREGDDSPSLGALSLYARVRGEHDVCERKSSWLPLNQGPRLITISRARIS